MTEPENEAVELGPIASELMKLSSDLHMLAETPNSSPNRVASDDEPPAQHQDDKSM